MTEIMKVTFKAYDIRGHLVLSTWANSPHTIRIEREVYQDRLKRGDFASVDVSCDDDPHFKSEVMSPNGRKS